MQMQGLMQQMGGMMEHMAARINAGPLTPEESKQMAELMRRITDMTNHLTWMMNGGTSVLDMSQQMATMTEQITEVHKRVMSLIAASMPASPKDKTRPAVRTRRRPCWSQAEVGWAVS
jgi:hypothetical protein